MSTTGVKGFHLSMQQSHVWTLQGDDRQAYTTQCALRVSGVPDMGAFLQAVRRVVERHSILRTSFFRLPGMDVPVQIVNEQMDTGCVVIDLEHLRMQTRELAWQTSFSLPQSEVFDLTSSSLLHVWLFRLSVDTHVLHISLPSLCADESTLLLYVRELCQTYDALTLCNASDTLPLQDTEEPLQYVDVAAWQDELLLEDDEVEHHRQYWRKIDLSHVSTQPLPVPEKRRETDNQGQNGKQSEVFSPCVHDIPVDKLLCTEIKKLTDRYHVSLAAYILACWYVTCLKMVSTTKIVMGVACDGRFNEELSSALGLYQRFVPMTVNLADDVPFVQVLRLLQANLTEAYEEQLYFSWEDSLSTTKIAAPEQWFPVSFEYDVWPATLQAGTLNLSLLKGWSCTEPFALKLSVRQIGERLQLALHYDPRVITGEQTNHLGSLLRTLLNNMTEQPQTTIGARSLLSNTERTHLLTTFGGPQRLWSKQGLYQLFEAQVQRYPDYLAVISSQEQFTYRQLNERANQLAHALRRRGIGPNVLVGLCVSRQAHMLVGMLGILKAGGAYLPLDVGSPVARLHYQLEESGTMLLLTQEELHVHLPTWGGSTLYLEELEVELAQAPVENQPVDSRDEDLAYVIYTSGSTGMPKGVMVRQSSMVNYTQALCEQLGSEAGWHYATVSTLAADLGNTAIFCALASGGCVQVLDYETITSGDALANWARLHPIDVLKIVPSHLSALLESEQAGELLPRRRLVLGGEALSGQLIERIHHLEGTCQIYNHYGPTETTIGVLVNILGSRGSLHEDAGASVGLGRPIANTQVYVLDQSMQLVPPGVTGELYIGGAGVAHGYVQQGEQTAAHFVPHPYSQVGGERLYRTGDLARYGQGAQIEFVGRRDGQVKLRGYRIELGEIEAMLRQYSQVRECLVMLREDIAGEPRLIGYVVGKQRVRIPHALLDEWLRQRLPEYMLPVAYVSLDEMSLTANGKVDRRQLPLPEQQIISGVHAGARPLSPLEEMVAQIWRDLLRIPVIGIDDNFFAIGGHSLLATRVIARLQAMLHVMLPIQLLFVSPTVAGLAQQIEYLLRQDEGIDMPPLVAGIRPAAIPLSFAQQRLWFLDRFQPESTGYLIPRVQQISGTLNVAALEQSLYSLAERHESLRTTFEERAGQPVQIIHHSTHIMLPMLDLSGLERDDRKLTARILVRQEAQLPCNLAQGPLFRLKLLRLEPHEHLLLLTLHHIITDGWSTEILARELTTLYQATLAGIPSPLPPLPIQYVDYALWQRQWLQDIVLEAHLVYWRKLLAGAAPLVLPTDHARPAVQTYRGARQLLVMPVALLEQLQHVSQLEGVTMFMLLLTAFQVLLQRYTGQNDISVGTPIANRTRTEIEGVIGFFVNTLVLRSDLSGDPTFQQLLKKVREVCLGAYAHQDIPFEKVVESLELERDLSRSPLFQVMLVLQEAELEPDPAALTGISMSTVEIENTERGDSKFDLTLSLTPTPQGLRCSMEYRTDLFEATTISRWLEHWQTLLVGIVSDLQAHLSEIPLLSARERELLLVEWNVTARETPDKLYVHQLFEQHVQRVPDAVALVCEDQYLTYEHLNRRANQLAQYLQSLGIGPETLVGLCIERSFEMMVGLLGVLKAGGAYVPLDPTYPQERLTFMMQDANIVLVLTQEHLRDRLLESERMLVCLDREWEQIAQQREMPPIQMGTVDQLAYVLYTSGSTGQPKGVMVPHRGLVNYLHWARQVYALPGGAGAPLHSPLGFDLTVTSLFVPLLTGQRVVLLPERQGLIALTTALESSHGFNLVKMTPSHLEALAGSLAVEQLATAAQVVILGGEALRYEHLAFWQQAAPETRLINEYGPTETVVGCCAYEVSQEALVSGAVPIGRPIANMQVYVVDAHGQIAPIGVSGELLVGGVGVTRGYIQRPDLTAERFIPDPWSQRPGARLYRTGDLARYLLDGTLEYLGRADQQVKIRGYRIELEEIASLLQQHRGVQEVVVLAREDVLGDRQIVAYVVLNQDQPATSGILYEYLQAKLPIYMLPSSFVALDALPLTPNGKVDRRALPRPEAVRPALEVAFVPPRTPAEEIVAAIWSQVLQVEQVGVFDNFFALGGHSLRAVQVIARVHDCFQVELPVRSLFERPTINDLINEVAQLRGGRPIIEEIALVLKEIEQLSQEEIREMLLH